jgi:SAM-dependent methyltransferase
MDNSQAAALWNQRYEGAEPLFGHEPNEYLRAKTPLLPPGGSVLCVADGDGRNSVWLARQGLRVQAFDISAVGVAKARRLAADAGVEVDHRVCACDAWPWAAATHDAVVAIFIQFADPATRATLFAQMARALKPGGVLVLQGYTPRQLALRTGGPSEVSHLYTAELLREAFADLQIEERSTTRPSSTKARGTSAARRSSVWWRARAETRPSGGYLLGYCRSARRFSAQAESSWPVALGFSRPQLTTSSCVSFTP